MSGQIDGSNRNSNIAASNIHLDRFSVNGSQGKETVLVVTVDPYKKDSVRHGGRDDGSAIAELLDALKDTDGNRGARGSSGVFDDILGDRNSHHSRGSNGQDTALARALVKALARDDDGVREHGSNHRGISESDMLALIVLAKTLKSPKDQNMLLKAVLTLEAGQHGRRGNDVDKTLSMLLGGGQAHGGRRRSGCDDVEDLEKLLEVVANSPQLSNKMRAKLEAVIVRAMVQKLEKLKGPQAEYALLKLAGSLPNLPAHMQKIVEAMIVKAIINTSQRDHGLVNLAMLAATVNVLNSDAKQKLVPVVLDCLRRELRNGPQNAGSLIMIGRSMGVSESSSSEFRNFITDAKRSSKAMDLSSTTGGPQNKASLEQTKSRVFSETSGNAAGQAGTNLRNDVSAALNDATKTDAAKTDAAQTTKPGGVKSLLQNAGDLDHDGDVDADDVDAGKPAHGDRFGNRDLHNTESAKTPAKSVFDFDGDDDDATTTSASPLAKALGSVIDSSTRTGGASGAFPGAQRGLGQRGLGNGGIETDEADDDDDDAASSLSDLTQSSTM